MKTIHLSHFRTFTGWHTVKAKQFCNVSQNVHGEIEDKQTKLRLLCLIHIFKDERKKIHYHLDPVMLLYDIFTSK